MQELNWKNFKLDGGPLGHLMVQGVNLGSVGPPNLFGIGQDDDLKSPVP